MKTALVDLNVILDFLNRRNHHESAKEVVDLCADKKIAGYLCAHEIKDVDKVKETITTILDIFTAIPVNERVLRSAILSPVSDYEDAVVEISAKEYGLDCIVSRNVVDFKNARIPVLLPEDFLREI
ncbi:MAG: PIN domain-containing protein [Spirochaetaceae bacterium]|jgi:predicted nucleic acid-binding protein|nr:PIN domain-containing protein [Spirochaetaceae bacterium]